MNKPAGTPLKLKTVSLKIQSHRETTLNSRITHIAATFVLAVVLGGCGGGGGGDSPGLNPAFAYPPLSKAVLSAADGGVSSNYSSPVGTQQFAQDVTSTVTFTLIPSPPSITLFVTGIADEPTFSFTVTDPAALVLLANSPLESLPSPCPGCLRAGMATDGITSITYLDPALAGMTYSTLGLWSKPSSVGGPDVGAAFSFGVVTRSQDLPILNATATYNGFMVGRYADGVDTYVVGANATATAFFTPGPTSEVTFSTNNTVISQEGGGPLVPQLGLNLSGTLNYNAGLNTLTGTLTAPGVVGVTMSGPTTARYYGPPTGAQAAPAEFGGAFFVSNPTQQMNGSFALKQ